MFNSRSIQGIIILIAGLFLAIWLGLSIVTNQIETILQVITAAVLITCLALGRKIWLLIPLMTAINIQLRIPGQPTTLLLAQILVLVFCSLLFLMRKLPFALRWTELEFWVVVLTLLVFQVYVRNPVGVNLFGGDTVGGKGYALYAISLLSAILLGGLIVPPDQLKWILRLSIIGTLTSTAISILGNYIPSIGYYTGETNGDSADDVGFDSQVIDDKVATRVDFLLGLSGSLALWISAFISPVRALTRPLWAILVMVAFVTAAYSGFRNGIITVSFTFLIGIAYRSGISGLAISILGGIGGLAVLAIVNSLYPLPPNIQRSLTFLPGTWERRYKDDATGSSEWRFDIWREALLSDRWIHNKWIGDGLGFTSTELMEQRNQRQGARAGISGFDNHRDTILTNGDYHSGPVSTIRVIGGSGLIFFVTAMIRLAVHAHRQILRCRGTEWYPLALYLGIPLVIAPVYFVLIFGDFKTGSGGFLLSVGMLRLLENNLPLPAYVIQRHIPFVLGASNRLRKEDRLAGSGRQGA